MSCWDKLLKEALLDLQSSISAKAVGVSRFLSAYFLRVYLIVAVHESIAERYLFMRSKSLMSLSTSVPKGMIGRSIDTVPETWTEVCLIWDTNFSMFLRV
jgi:hypothetical protein